MFYAIYVPPYYDLLNNEERPQTNDLVFSDIKEANTALKRYKGSRMKIFPTLMEAMRFLDEPEQEESFIDLDSSCHDMVTSFEKLSVNQQSSPKSPKATNLTSASSLNSPSALFASPKRPLAPYRSQSSPITSSPTAASSDGAAAAAAADDDDEEEEPNYPSAKPGMLGQLRRKIEAGDYEAVENTIWSNPRCLVSVSDSAIYLMAGPKYNACHIAARANKPDIMALLLDTVSNFSFIRKLYPRESDFNIQDRVNHLLDSYLNTPDPRQGNTPLHFACKLGFYRVVRVLLTFEGCDLGLRDGNGQTAEECICSQYRPPAVDLAEQLREKLNFQTTESGGGGGGEQADGNKSTVMVDPSTSSETQLSNVKQKIRNMFKQQFHLPLYRDQLKKRLILERRRSRASSQMDSDTSFSDIDDSFILNSPTKLNKSVS